MYIFIVVVGHNEELSADELTDDEGEPAEELLKRRKHDRLSSKEEQSVVISNNSLAPSGNSAKPVSPASNSNPATPVSPVTSSSPATSVSSTTSSDSTKLPVSRVLPSETTSKPVAKHKPNTSRVAVAKTVLLDVTMPAPKSEMAHREKEKEQCQVLKVFTNFGFLQLYYKVLRQNKEVFDWVSFYNATNFLNYFQFPKVWSFTHNVTRRR